MERGSKVYPHEAYRDITSKEMGDAFNAVLLGRLDETPGAVMTLINAGRDRLRDVFGSNLKYLHPSFWAKKDELKTTSETLLDYAQRENVSLGKMDDHDAIRLAQEVVSALPQLTEPERTNLFLYKAGEIRAQYVLLTYLHLLLVNPPKFNSQEAIRKP